MSWLTPWYLLGAGMIALPYLLHLWQRAATRRFQFSSLMFLSPTRPPTRRRRHVENWWLLLLRCLAIVLLAIAFARPFFRQPETMTRVSKRQRVAVLIDRSASMRREPLAKEVARVLQDSLAKLADADRVALFAFDERLERLTEWRPATAATRAQIQERVSQWTPTWRATDMGQALSDALEQLAIDARDEMETGAAVRPGRLIVITDFQEGARWQGLDQQQWPPHVSLELQIVEAAPGNAAPQVLWTDEASDAVDDLARLRITHDGQLKEPLILRTGEETDQPESPPPISQAISLAPGAAPIVNVAIPARSTYLEISGDRHTFDNRWYVAASPKRKLEWWYMGPDVNEPTDLSYYLRRVDLSSGRADATLRIESTEPREVPDVQRVPLVIMSNVPSSEHVRRWLEYVGRGGHLIVVLPHEDSSANHASSLAPLRELLDAPTLDWEMTTAPHFALWAQIAYDDPLLAAFRDARYNDFSKIRFWRYRKIVGELPAHLHTLVGFDDRSPAIVLRTVGQGRIYVWTTSWLPADSQLAGSTKFVPLLANSLTPPTEGMEVRPTYVIGQPIPLRDSDAAEGYTVKGPRQQLWNLPARTSEFKETNEPGRYVVTSGATTDVYAVNLSPAETNTLVADRDKLRLRGVRLADTREEIGAEQTLRRRAAEAQEADQSLWRWLIIGSLAVLVAETCLAYRIDRRPERLVEEGFA